MAKRIKNNKGEERKEGFFKKIARKFSESSQRAQRATVVLFILILLSIIAGIVGFYLAEPAKEMYVSESTFVKESRNIYDFKADSAERTAQVQKADEAEKVYASVMDKYTNNENAMVAWYAGIHSNFLKVMVAILIVLPFLGIGTMFIGSPKNFIFALINMLIVVPIIAIVYLFNSFRNEEKNFQNSPKKMLEAAE